MPEDKKSMLPQKKILVVEDEKPMARALELKLTHSGFQVKIASDGEQALSFIQAEPFDLIMLDLVIPKTDGFKVLAEMKAKNITIPVMVTSNLSQEEDRKKVLELGARDYFVKSDTPIATLVEQVKKILAI